MNITEALAKELNFHQYFSRVLFLMVSSSTLVSLTGSMVVLLSFILHGMDIAPPLLVAVFTLTFAFYNLDRAVKQKEDFLNDPGRSRIFEGRRRVWGVVAVASLATSIALGAVRGLGVLLTLLSPLAVYAGYTIGLPSKRRIKDIPGVKNLVLAATWTLIPTVLPNLCKTESWGETSILLSTVISYFIFTKIMINSILFDVRDINGDTAAGIKTLPIMLGIRKTRRLLFVFNVSLTVWIALCWYLSLFLPYLTILVANIIYGFWYINYFTGNPDLTRIFTDLFVDGEWIPLTLVITFIHVL